jgi:isopenicillin-N N-acyltransferase-like protein
MKELRLPPGLSARERGRVHGETFRQDIVELAGIRTSLIAAAWLQQGPDRVRERAREHLPLLQQYDADLYEEFQGIAEGAGISEADLLILNHYTDLRDLSPVEEALEEGCTILHVRYGDEALIGQTWDMHATAGPYVMMMYLPDEGVWVQTVTGCLALCGMNSRGLAVAINNLVMGDARVGVSWPTLVRRMLRDPNVLKAEETLIGTRVGSGHHYLLADRELSVAWEISGTQSAVTFHGKKGVYVHANHCLDSKMEALSQISPTSTTSHRQCQAEELLKEIPQPTPEELWQMLGCRVNFPYSLFTDRRTPDNPHGVATCAKVLMDVKRGEIWARSGFESPDLDAIVYRFH